MISPFHATILGIVEGLTEFLPVSSTGHLILTQHLLGLGKTPGTDAFEIVIQGGALLAVIGLYLKSVRSMTLGVFGRDRDGLALLMQLMVAFVPAAVIGLAGEKAIKERLFLPIPVALALAVGGVAMILIERWRVRRSGTPEAAAHAGLPLGAMTLRAAFIIGVAQCFALWPGTSRSMVTILAGLLLGYSPRAAAEFSFLLALPTLGAATAHDLLGHYAEIMAAAGPLSLAIGCAVSCVVAFLAVKWFIAFLTSHGMAIFGWYRIVLAVLVMIMWH